MIQKASWFIAIFFVFAFSLVAVQSPALADDPLETCDVAGDPLGLNCAGHTGLTKQDPRIVAGRIIQVSLGLLGIVATVLIIYAGFRWMTAGGNEDSVKTARQILFSAVIGLVIILTAYAVTNFVLRELFEATTKMPYGTPL